jgi:carbon monoxide dehydrogenase subunit G
MIQISERFDVPCASPDFVWDLLSDPKAVVECVPGAALGEEHEDGSFDGSLTVKFGPARVTFRAHIELELDAAAKTGRVTSRGKDSQGGTRFRAAMTFKVLEQAEGEQPGATVFIEGENEISGKLAGLVESGAKIVIKRMSAEFAQNLAARCAATNAQ